jgi:aconitate decarboxylase
MAAQYEAMCKRMHHGFSARAGVYSAVLAGSGFTGIKRCLEREYGGYLATYSLGGKPPEPGAVTGNLGEHWEIDRISIKPYAVQGGTHAAIDAVNAIRQRRPLPAADIAAVRIAVGHTVYHHGVWELRRPIDEITAQMSLAYGTAVAILDGQVLPAQFLPDRLSGQDVWSLIDRITMRHDESIDAAGPRARLRTALEIEFTDGTTEAETVDTPSGGLDRPLSNAAVRAKFDALTGNLLSPDRQAAVRDAVLGLAGLPDVATLSAVLAPPVPNPLALP